MNEKFSPPEEALIEVGAVPQKYFYGPDDADEENADLKSNSGKNVDSEDENEVNI
jgi:hypothetical protein